MSILFISDVHLSPEQHEIAAAFYRFLSTEASKAHALYILGDLFETWIGDDDPSELANEVQDRLRALTSSGTKVYLQHGNRDFLLGSRFERKTGAKLVSDYHIICEYGHRALLMHGDLLCTDDHAYQAFRRKVRNPVYRWILRNLPLSKRQEMALRWRTETSRLSKKKASQIMDVNQRTVETVSLKTNTSILVHGHTHRPKRHRFDHEKKERIVLGDWGQRGWALKLDSKGFELYSFLLGLDKI